MAVTAAQAVGTPSELKGAEKKRFTGNWRKMNHLRTCERFMGEVMKTHLSLELGGTVLTRE